MCRAEGQTETLPEQGSAVGLTNRVGSPGATMGTSRGAHAAALASPVALRLCWHTPDENVPTPLHSQTHTFVQAFALAKATGSQAHTAPRRAVRTHRSKGTCTNPHMQMLS